MRAKGYFPLSCALSHIAWRRCQQSLDGDQRSSCFANGGGNLQIIDHSEYIAAFRAAGRPKQCAWAM
jgi:hypothetical protein